MALALLLLARIFSWRVSFCARSGLTRFRLLGNAFACHPISELQLNGMSGASRMIVSPCLGIPGANGRPARKALGRVVDQTLSRHSVIRTFCERAAQILGQFRQALATFSGTACRANVTVEWMIVASCGVAAAVEVLHGNFGYLVIHHFQPLAVQAHPSAARGTLHTRVARSDVDLTGDH